MSFPSICAEGGLIPADILQEVAAGEAVGQPLVDFRLPCIAHLLKTDPAITAAHERWSLPSLRSSGHDEVTSQVFAEPATELADPACCTGTITLVAVATDSASQDSSTSLTDSQCLLRPERFGIVAFISPAACPAFTLLTRSSCLCPN